MTLISQLDIEET